MTTAPHFTFIALDARAASRAATLALLAERPTLGIEVTDTDLASACQLGNIDPQHGHHQSWTGWPAHVKGEAAILFALRLPLGLVEPGAVLATVRPDLDSVGAMAVMVLRSACGFAAPYVGHQSPLDPGRVNAVDIGVTERIEVIARADSFRPGPWAPRPIPTPENLWPLAERQEAADGHRALAHIAAICSPRPGQPSLPLEERVAIVACWIMWGDPIEPGFGESPGPDSWANPARKHDEWAILKACGANPAMSAPVLASNVVTSRRVVDSSRASLAAELAKSGAVKVLCRGCGGEVDHDLRASQRCAEGCSPGYAIVRVSHAGALGAGYCLAPAVVAFDQANPGKVTIAAAEDGRVDFARLRGALNDAETLAGGGPTWGGPRNLLGSPQGDGTRLSEATILRLVEASLA